MLPHVGGLHPQRDRWWPRCGWELKRSWPGQPCEVLVAARGFDLMGGPGMAPLLIGDELARGGAGGQAGSVITPRPDRRPPSCRRGAHPRVKAMTTGGPGLFISRISASDPLIPISPPAHPFVPRSSGSTTAPKQRSSRHVELAHTDDSALQKGHSGVASAANRRGRAPSTSPPSCP